MKLEVTEVSLLFGAATLRLVGQVPGIDPSLAGLVGNVGIIAVLIWHLWYHTTHSYPKMLQEFGAEAKAMREAFEKEQDKLRAAFLNEQQLLRSHAATETAELRTMLWGLSREMRTAVHDVKDTAQSTMAKVTLAQAQIDAKTGPPGPGATGTGT